MFDHIGSKIKGLAVIACVVGIIACVIVGLMLISESSYRNPTAGLGWTVLIGGSLGMWLSSFGLYGFGELVEKTCENNAALLRLEKELIELRKEAASERNKEAKKNEAPVESVKPEAPVAVIKKDTTVESDQTAQVQQDIVNSDAGRIDETVVQQIQEMRRASDIYAYVAENFDSNDEEIGELLKILKRATDLEMVYGNNKAGAVAYVEAFVKHGNKTFFVDRYEDQLTCPVCGCVQRLDRNKCQSCGALFKN